ncbi:hypothetical protein HYS29_02530 [Candidatus Microgenomates bacterium]|nr:hypothetical protein [Candidatus Microgenomates bacterium]
MEDTKTEKASVFPGIATELASAQIMMGLEMAHDMTLYPAKYAKYGLRPDKVGPLPNPNTDPVAAWAVDHIGDIWEISAGHTALRLGFVAVNEVLKKTTGKEIPDEACFWASLVTTVTIKAIHSLGYISLFGIHDHMDQPVPGMLFGQGVAAVVLAASHYAAKYHEPIKDLALRAARKIKEFDTMMKNPRRPDVTPNIAVNTVDEQNNKGVF